MIPSGTNSPTSRGIDPVIVTLTTGWMIPTGTNSPTSRGIDPVIVIKTQKSKFKFSVQSQIIITFLLPLF
jgi:hypothetical protein